MRSAIVRAGAPLASALLISPALTGCGGSHKSVQGEPHPTRITLGLSSSAFLDGSSIPARYTCDGEDVSPPLTWTRIPVRARSLALLVEDVDAPGGAFVHWSLYDLPRGSSGLSAGRVPSGTAEGQNSFGRSGYGGPCPPKGDPEHRYVFSLYALDDHPGLPPGATPATVRAAIAGHAITTGALAGLYRR
jgi:Raf kinase inhibitor-like YbhB/YbcL family protein